MQNIDALYLHKIDPGPLIGTPIWNRQIIFPLCQHVTVRIGLQKWSQEVSKLVEEVYQSIDYSLLCVASTGIRTVIDRIITDKIGDRGNFNDKVNKLVRDGLIDSDEEEPLRVLIDSGSASAHRGFSPDELIINHMIDIMENIIYKINITPIDRNNLKKNAELLRDKIPKRK